MDDDFMRFVLKDQRELVELLLRTLAGEPALTLHEAETQRDLRHLGGRRSVMLDLWGRDDSGDLWAVEVQRSQRGSSPLRSRHIASSLDVDGVPEGAEHESYPGVNVIFITEGDALGGGRARQTLLTRCAETGAAIADRRRVIYASARLGREEDSPFGDLMHDFLEPDWRKMRVPELAERVRYVKETTGGEGMCEIIDELRERSWNRGVERGLSEGIERGRSEGIEQGRELSLVESLRSLMANLSVGLDAAMDLLSVPDASRPSIRELLASS